MQHRARGVAAALAIASLVAAAPAGADPNPAQRAQFSAQARAEAAKQPRPYYMSHKPAIPGPGHDFRTIDARDAAEAPDGAVTRVTAVTPQPGTSDGFQWDDAAIGAGGALGLVLVLAGGGAAVSRRNRLATS
jgi:hypothetical protein